MDSKIELQKYWDDKNSEEITDQMVMDLKEELKVKPYEGLMIVHNDDHVKFFNEPIPEGFVAWLIVDKRIPKMDGYFLKDDNVCYTTPYGENGMRRK